MSFINHLKFNQDFNAEVLNSCLYAYDWLCSMPFFNLRWMLPIKAMVQTYFLHFSIRKYGWLLPDGTISHNFEEIFDDKSDKANGLDFVYIPTGETISFKGHGRSDFAHGITIHNVGKNQPTRKTIVPFDLIWAWAATKGKNSSTIPARMIVFTRQVALAKPNLKLGVGNVETGCRPKDYAFYHHLEKVRPITCDVNSDCKNAFEQLIYMVSELIWNKSNNGVNYGTSDTIGLDQRDIH